MTGALPTIAAGWLTFYLLIQWMAIGDDNGIPFSAAEVAFLFSAPWPRSGLIAYKVMNSIVAGGFSGLLMALIFSHQAMFSRQAPVTALAWMLVMAVLQLYATFASIIAFRLQGASIRAARRRQLTLGAGVIVLIGIFYAARHSPEIGAAKNPSEFIVAVGASRPLGFLLWPARLMVQPFFASGVVPVLRALGIVALILAGLASAIIRLEMPFEEASIAGSEKLAARLQRMRQTGTIRRAPTSERRNPFALDRLPGQWIALLWKNLLASSGWWLGIRRWAQVAAILVVLSIVLSHAMGSGYWRVAKAMMMFGWMGLFAGIVYGPMLIRFDLRQDLGNLDILRTYPMPGWRMMLGLISAPTAIITSYVWLSLEVIFLAMRGQAPSLPREWFNPAMRAFDLGCALAITPLLTCVQLFIPNMMATLFPTLLRPAQAGGAVGIDQFGQRILLMFGQLITLLIALAPAVLVAWLFIFASKWILGAGPALILGCLGAAVVLVGELWLGIWWLGTRFERMELA
jgi:hypothetical protein